MIVEKPQENSRSTVVAQNATISASALPFIFATLSKHLYSRKHDSVVRELCSNMRDAHLMAGNENVAFEIKYDSVNRQIHFRDFGTGMSPEIMQSIYNGWGDSLNRNSADTLGHFGLGSKSPFCLVKTYNIITIFEGIKYSYSYKLDGKLPELRLLSQFATSEPSGTDVWFITQDYREFTDACKKELRYFVGVNCIGLDMNTEAGFVRGKHFIINKKYQNTEVEICLGCVRYSIDWSYLGILAIKGNYALYFDVKEGFLPTPNRENLQMTEEVKKKILDKLELVRLEFVELYKKQTPPTDSIFKFKQYSSATKFLTVSSCTIDLSNIMKFTPHYEHLNPIYNHAGRIDMDKVTSEVIYNIFQLHSIHGRLIYMDKEKADYFNNNYAYAEGNVDRSKCKTLQQINYMFSGVLKAKSKWEENIKFNTLITLFSDYISISLVPIDPTNPHGRKHNVFTFDKGVTQLELEQELREFYQRIILELKTKLMDFDNVIPTKELYEASLPANKEEILGFFGRNDRREKKTVYQLKKVKQLVRCETKEEFHRLQSIFSEMPFVYKTTKKYIGLWWPVYCSDTQFVKLKKATNIVTFQEFIKSDWLVYYMQKQEARWKFMNSFCYLNLMGIGSVSYVNSTIEEIQEGYYQKFAVRQKKKNTYYVWSLPDNPKLRYFKLMTEAMKKAEAIRFQYPSYTKEANKQLVMEFLRKRLNFYKNGSNLFRPN